jgi:hypothetical protein
LCDQNGDSEATSPKSGLLHAIKKKTLHDVVYKEDILERAELAINLLINKPGPYLSLVREIRHEINNDLCWNGGPFQRFLISLTGGSTVMTVVWGAICTSIVGIFTFTLISAFAHELPFFKVKAEVIAGTAVPAFCGAIVSILARLDNFETAKGSDPKLIFMTAFFKPYIGMVTGVFIVCAIAVGVGEFKNIRLVPGQDGIQKWPGDMEYYFLYFIGFLAGFSERLTRDFVGAAEERIAGSGRTTTARGNS